MIKLEEDFKQKAFNLYLKIGIPKKDAVDKALETLKLAKNLAIHENKPLRNILRRYFNYKFN